MTAAASAGPPAFHLLAKPTGAVCNLDCSYCFYLSRELLYAGSRFRMADDLLETYIRDLIECHRSDEVTISWQGGEPLLMGLAFFERSVRLAEKHRRPATRLVYTIQTNATLLDGKWAQFFRQHDFLVGISIDGPRHLHDVYRVGKKGQPTFDKVMQGLAHLRQHGVEYNTLTCLHRANAGHAAEVYRFLRDDCGSRFMQFIPVVEQASRAGDGRQPVAWFAPAGRDPAAEGAKPAAPVRIGPADTGNTVTTRSIRPAQYGDFLIGVFEEWVRRDVGTVYVQMFDTALANWLGAPPGMCVHSERCGTALALEHNGDLYSCDHFVEPKHKLGNIGKDRLIDLVGSPRQRKFGDDKFDSLPRYCLDCTVRRACHGGCPKDRFVATPDGDPGLNYLCEGYKAFFRHVSRPLGIMAELLRQGRAPSVIMARYNAQPGESAAAGGDRR